MAKKSVRNRNFQRVQEHARLKTKRDQLRSDVINPELSDDDRWNAMLAMQKLSRDSSKSRQRNRCKVCGRPRGYNRLTGLCRMHMRLALIFGLIPGMRKASW